MFHILTITKKQYKKTFKLTANISSATEITLKVFFFPVFQVGHHTEGIIFTLT